MWGWSRDWGTQSHLGCFKSIFLRNTPKEQTPSSTDLPQRISVKGLCVHPRFPLLWRGKCFSRRFGFFSCHCWGDSVEGVDKSIIERFDSRARRTSICRTNPGIQEFAKEISNPLPRSKTQEKCSNHSPYYCCSGNSESIKHRPSSAWWKGQVNDGERPQYDPSWQTAENILHLQSVWKGRALDFNKRSHWGQSSERNMYSMWLLSQDLFFEEYLEQSQK